MTHRQAEAADLVTRAIAARARRQGEPYSYAGPPRQYRPRQYRWKQLSELPLPPPEKPEKHGGTPSFNEEECGLLLLRTHNYLVRLSSAIEEAIAEADAASK